MSKGQRIRSAFTGLLMIICSIVMVLIPKIGIPLIILLMGLSFTLSGIRMILFYITMARHMVDGKLVLYKGVIILDLGLLALSLSTVPSVYLMIYLIIGHLFAGVMDIFRARTARKMEANAWKNGMLEGVINIMIAIICMAFISSASAFVYAYALGLCFSGCSKIHKAFQKTAIVYIQ